MNSTKFVFAIATISMQLFQLQWQDVATNVLLAQTPIVLRDLSLIRDKSIVAFDQHSIRLSDGSELGWDAVLKAELEPNEAKAFDNNVQQIGLPLFRLKSRISNGDWDGAGEIAIPVFTSSFLKQPMSTSVDLRDSDQQKAIDHEYLICLAAMKSFLNDGRRVEALVPFVRASILQPKIGDDVRLFVGSAAIPSQDAENLFSRELVPIWFDHSGLTSLSTQLAESGTSTELAQSIGLRLYLASIQIELGRPDEGLQSIQTLDFPESSEFNAWRSILDARRHQTLNKPRKALSILDSEIKKMSGSARLAALFLQGTNLADIPNATDSENAKSLLTLIRIPALYGDEQPALAAAAIFQAAEIAELRKRDSDSQKLRDELLRRYPRTYHGRLEQEKRLGHEGPNLE